MEHPQVVGEHFCDPNYQHFSQSIAIKMGGVLQYKGRCTTIQKGGVLKAFPFPQGSEATKILQYKLDVYCYAKPEGQRHADHHQNLFISYIQVVLSKYTIQRVAKGGWKTQGRGEHTIRPSPKTVLDPLPLSYDTPPLCLSMRPVISLKGNESRPDQSHFLRPPRVVLEGALYDTFPPPFPKSHDTFPPVCRCPNYVMRLVPLHKNILGRVPYVIGIAPETHMTCSANLERAPRKPCLFSAEKCVVSAGKGKCLQESAFCSRKMPCSAGKPIFLQFPLESGSFKWGRSRRVGVKFPFILRQIAVVCSCTGDKTKGGSFSTYSWSLFALVCAPLLTVP